MGREKWVVTVRFYGIVIIVHPQHEPLARKIVQALPVLLKLNK